MALRSSELKGNCSEDASKNYRKQSLKIKITWVRSNTAWVSVAEPLSAAAFACF
jgi:hypothetical protein